ncbi:hypothetical protein JTB14_002263 [Gonioctena quinquepunctata]|nr:hypothetical protein JTB14_002263 [Gonioctena quinquepunctata]
MRNLVAVLFLAFAVVISHPISDEENERLHKINVECAKVSGLDEETLKKMEDDLIFPTEGDEIKVHSLCFMKGLKVMGEDGKIDKEEFTTSLKLVVTDDKATEIVEKCTIEKESGEETAYELGKCVHDELKLALAD